MPQRVLMFHYTLTNDQGLQLDASVGGEPFPVLEGQNQIIPVLEKELFGMLIGAKKKIRIAADQAYGRVNDKMKIEVTRAKLPAGDIRIGSQFQTGDPGNPVFTVTKIEGEEIHLDGNHPMAGIDLTFDVEVVDIRNATVEELTHGHAHGGDGHHH